MVILTMLIFSVWTISMAVYKGYAKSMTMGILWCIPLLPEVVLFPEALS